MADAGAAPAAHASAPAMECVGLPAVCPTLSADCIMVPVRVCAPWGYAAKSTTLRYQMKPDANLIFLIDAAQKIAGSDYKVAKLIGTTPQRISDWRHGRKPCPPEDQALMASVAGFDPQTTALRAMVEKHEGTAKGDRLMRVLGKALPAIGAALGSAGASAASIGSTIPTPSHGLEWLAAGIYTMYKRITIGVMSTPFGTLKCKKRIPEARRSVGFFMGGELRQQWAFQPLALR